MNYIKIVIMTYFNKNIFENILSYCDDRIERKQKKLMNKVLADLSLDDVIKKTCCKNAGVYKYHQVFEGCKITNGTYINIKLLICGNGWKLYGINQDFSLDEKEVIGKSKCFVKIEGERKKKIKNDNILGDYFKYENIRGFFINKEIMKGNKYIVFRTN